MWRLATGLRSHLSPNDSMQCLLTKPYWSNFSPSVFLDMPKNSPENINKAPFTQPCINIAVDTDTLHLSIDYEVDSWRCRASDQLTWDDQWSGHCSITCRPCNTWLGQDCQCCYMLVALTWLIQWGPKCRTPTLWHLYAPIDPGLCWSIFFSCNWRLLVFSGIKRMQWILKIQPCVSLHGLIDCIHDLPNTQSKNSCVNKAYRKWCYTEKRNILRQPVPLYGVAGNDPPLRLKSCLTWFPYRNAG